MSWRNVAEDVAFEVLLARPHNQNPGGVHFLRAALLGLTSVPDCPPEYQQQASKLVDDYIQLERNPGQYVEWNEAARETHLLLAKLGGCESEVARYYS
jgi:hypothetical protein